MLVHRSRTLSHRPAAVSATRLCHAPPTGNSDVVEHGSAERFQIRCSENGGTGSPAPSEVGGAPLGAGYPPRRAKPPMAPLRGGARTRIFPLVPSPPPTTTTT